MQNYDIHIDEQQRERTKHGSFGFPFVVYENQLSRNVLGYINWHWHEELQFSFVTRGSVTFYVNQTSLTLHVGQGIFLNSAVLHSIHPTDEVNSTYVCVDVHPMLLRGFPGNTVAQKYIQPYLNDKAFICKLFSSEHPDELIILEHLDQLKKLYDLKAKGYELSILIHLLSIWQQLIELQPEKNAAPAIPEQDNERLKLLLSLVHDHYSEKLSLQAFADAVHLCSSECCRLFKRYMHCTIFDYLIDYRIERSINALLTSDASISRIAYDYGFGTTSYYISRFRRKTGQTPLDFRRSNSISDAV